MHNPNIANSLLKNKAPRQSEGTNEVLTGNKPSEEGMRLSRTGIKFSNGNRRNKKTASLPIRLLVVLQPQTQKHTHKKMGFKSSSASVRFTRRSRL